MSLSWTVVDDNSSDITYLGSWKNEHDNDFFMDGYHFTTPGDDASLSYSFNGSDVIVSGCFTGKNTIESNTAYPGCSVDDIPMILSPKIPPNGSPFFCSASNLSTQHPHKLAVNTQSTSIDQTFRIDFIAYDPGSSMDASHGVGPYIQYPNSSTPNFTFDEEWSFDGVGHPINNPNASIPMAFTWTANSIMTYQFYGTSITWFGCCVAYSSLISFNAAKAAYTIDGSNSTSFQIDEGSLLGPACMSQRILFQDTTLSAGSHNLTVTYYGNKNKMPLNLCGIASTTTSNLVSFNQPSDQPLSSRSPLSPSTGVIVGSVIGGLVFTFLLIYVPVFILRRKRSRSKRAFTPFDVTPQSSPESDSPDRSVTYGPEKFQRAQLLSTTVPNSLESPENANDASDPRQGAVEEVRRARQQELERRLRVMQQDMADLTVYLDDDQHQNVAQNTSATGDREQRHDTAGDGGVNVDDQLRSLRRQIAYLQEQQHSAWAQGLSDELPPGYTPTGIQNHV